MPSTQPSIRRLGAPDPALIGADATAFLKHLAAPSWLEIPGRDPSRRRALVTLLHGNEPSGLKAIHRLLKGKVEPATDLGILVASVDAALFEPCFSHRYIPGERDLNRCFAPPYTTDQGRLAGAILDLLHDYAPEAVIDAHNTSSHSEPFCVAVREDPATVRMAGLFTDLLIVIRRKLGTLLEHLDPSIPALTVEFGGFMDANADWFAGDMLHRFVVAREPGSPARPNMTLLRAPLRLETRRQVRVSYSSAIDPGADITMINTIDQLNFRRLDAGTPLGWFRDGHSRGLVVYDSHAADRYADYFDHSGGILTNRRPMTIFMATTDPAVAGNDCLLYFTTGDA